MSPNEQKVTSGREAIASARSISSSGVTQTGQPGPWTRRTADGSSSSMPNLRIEWVWPPQTSISVQGRVTVAWMLRTTACHGRRIAVLVDVAHQPFAPGAGLALVAGLVQLAERRDLGEGRERLLRLLLVDARDREAHVDEHVVAERDLRHVGEARLALDAGEVHLPHPQLALTRDLDDLSRNRQTHASVLSIALRFAFVPDQRERDSRERPSLRHSRVPPDAPRR